MASICRLEANEKTMNHTFEMIMTAIFSAAGILMRHGLSREAVLYVPLSFIMAVCACSDLEKRVIPGEALKAGAVYRMAAVICAENALKDLAGAALGAAALFLILLPVSMIYERVSSRRSIGGGDIKLLILSGAYLGPWGGLTALMAACVSGLACGLASGKTPSGFPWGPAIALGVFAGMIIM